MRLSPLPGDGGPMQGISGTVPGVSIPVPCPPSPPRGQPTRVCSALLWLLGGVGWGVEYGKPTPAGGHKPPPHLLPGWGHSSSTGLSKFWGGCVLLGCFSRCWFSVGCRSARASMFRAGGGGLWFGPSWEINPGMSLAASGSKPGMGHQGGFRPLSSACPWCAASIGSVGKMRSIRKHFPSWSEPGSLDQARSSRGKRWEGDGRVGCRGLP